MRLLGMIVTAVFVFSSWVSAGTGIVVQANEKGSFEYVDDFSTPRFLQDTVSATVAVENWSPGMIAHQGPVRNREMVYRFIADGVVKTVDIRIEQGANEKNFGGQNYVYLSSNGLDWTLMASSKAQPSDKNGWQTSSFIITSDQAKSLIGQQEIWLRIVLDNISGMETNISNKLTKLAVKLTTEKTNISSADTRSEPRTAKIRQKSDFRAITLDVHDPIDVRSPYYFEQADGWLVDASSLPEDKNGLVVQQEFRGGEPPRLSLAMFAKLDQSVEALATRITIHCSKETTRKMNVVWDGEITRTVDTGEFFDQDRIVDIVIPGPVKAGVHELRFVPIDNNPVIIKQVSLSSEASLAWAKKPELPAEKPLTILSACYLPDRKPPIDSQVAEGRQVQLVGLTFSSLQQMYKRHAEFGALRINVRNTGKVPVRISQIELNSKPIEAWYVDFAKSAWDDRGVVWYRIHPQTLKPNQCGEIYVRFRQRLKGESAEVTIQTENAGKTAVQIPFTDPDILVDYVTTDATMKRLIAYVKPYSNVSKSQKITSAILDGEPLANAKIIDPEMTGGVAVITADLPHPLKVGDYHTFGVKTASNRQWNAEFRTLAFEFPRNSIYVPAERCREVHMNLLLWSMQPKELCDQYDVNTTTIINAIFNLHDRVTYVLGPDEPDAHDNQGGGYDRGLGYYGRSLAESHRLAMIERYAPARPWWVIMNGTTRPLNWCVYGQMADISSFDPYPVTFYGADHAYVRESLLYARMTGAPRRMIACLETYGWSKGQGVPSNARGPSCEEYRQNVTQAIGSGAKGLTSWVYPERFGGWENRKDFAAAITDMNRIIEHIESELLIATPVDWARTDAGLVKTGTDGNEKWNKERVWAGALLAGHDAIIVAVANHIPANKAHPPKIEPATSVNVTVDLPSHLTQVTAGEVTPDGLVDYPCQIHEGKAILNLKTITDGRIFIFRKR